MASPAEAPPKIQPAQLSFLAIYNPSLGQTDETFRDQVVFYYSKHARSKRKGKGTDERERQEEENEKLRQIGLAQGMVGFARGFAEGESVDSVETERSRIVMHELQTGWWILASIDLTRLPRNTALASPPAGGQKVADEDSQYDYSSREVSSPSLLLQQILTAQSIFALHHGPSLDELFTRLGRPRFSTTLERFWTAFALNWDVLLHGNPAVDAFGGIKLATGGELGIGVGEEEWGSGEREVLEDFVSRTDGLVDLVVSRFGEPARVQSAAKELRGVAAAQDLMDPVPWMGAGAQPTAADGLIFSGMGAISRTSLRNLSHWLQSIYMYGEFAYGVKENPLSDRRRRRRRQPSGMGNGDAISKPPLETRKSSTRKTVQRQQSRTKSPDAPNPGIPRPIVSAAEKSLKTATSKADAHVGSDTDSTSHNKSGITDPDVWVKYLTLGYGTAWGGQSKRSDPSPSRPSQEETPKQEQHDPIGKSPEGPLQKLDPQPEGSAVEDKTRRQKRLEVNGHFLIGLQGDLDSEDTEDDVGEASKTDSDGAGGSETGGARTVVRTLQVEVVKTIGEDEDTPQPQQDSGAQKRARLSLERLRVVIYVRRPFIFAFLFTNRTDSLMWPTLYRNIHHHLGPLQKPLAISTSPANIAARISASNQDIPNGYTSDQTASSASRQGNSPAPSRNNHPIFDLVYDPTSLTVHTSIPNIPEPGTLAAKGISPSGISKTSTWTRIEALNVHTQILNTLSATKRSPADLERTCKTSRGWWIVWMRLPASTTVYPYQLPSTSEDDGYPRTPYEEKGSINPSSSASNAPTITTDGGYPFPPKSSSRPTPQRQSSLQHRSATQALPPSRKHDHTVLGAGIPDNSRIAILVRRATDAPSSGGKAVAQRHVSGRGFLASMGVGSGEEGGGGGWLPGGTRLAEGIGIDARRYVEGLLSLNR